MSNDATAEPIERLVKFSLSTPVGIEATAAFVAAESTEAEIETDPAAEAAAEAETAVEAAAETAATDGDVVEQDAPGPVAQRVADAMRTAQEAAEADAPEGETADAEAETVTASVGPVSEALVASGAGNVELFLERQALVAAGRAQSDEAAQAAETAELQVMIDPANPGRFRSIMVVEEERTADNRMIAKGATAWRPTPLPLMLMTRTDVGHDGSEVSGVYETITRRGAAIVGEGRFDTGAPGLEAARLVANQVLTQVSIDGGDVEVEYVVEEEDEDGFPVKILARITAITVLGATVVPFPAIGSTLIEWISPDEKTATDVDEFIARVIPGFTVEEIETAAADDDCAECAEGESLAAAGPKSFPSASFENPKLAAPTPVHVADDERVVGHLALWGTCHTSFKTCVTPPRTKTAYQHYLVGTLPLEEGGYQPVGTITLDAMHADHRLKARDAAQHYDHTGKAVAYVNIGEDEHGIWVSGVLKPGVSEELATALCGASLSGDWRNIGGNLELVAVLGVNVPGFPVAHQKDDQQMSLVAAGYGPDRRARPLSEAYAAEADALGRRASMQVEEVRGEIATMRGELIEARAEFARLQEEVAPLLVEEYRRRLSATPATRE